MAAKSVTHSVSLAVGDISLALSNTQTADASPTNFVLGDQQVTSAGSPEYLGRAEKAHALGDVEMSGHKVMLLLRNDTASGGGDLLVSLADNTTYEVSIKPQNINLLTITDLQDVKVDSSSGNVDYTYLVVQLDE